MKRREFVRSIGAAAVLGRVAARPHGPGPAFRNWVWVHGDGEAPLADWQRRFARLREAGISGVLVLRGNLPMLGDAAHAAGLEFHRWIMTLNRGADALVKERHPEWFTVSRAGDSSLTKPPYQGYYQWLCPTRPEVREYLRGLVAEIAGDPRVDGVHLDYIRHADVILPVGLWAQYKIVQDREYPQYDFCYCEACRARFAHETGTDPLDLRDPTQDVAWRQFRWTTVTEVVEVLAGAVHELKKRISAAVFPTPTLARQLVRQAWDRWPLDAVFPMLYHTFYDEDLAWIGSATREGVTALPAGTPLYSGLFLPSLVPEDLAAAVRLARDAGAAGVCLFELESLTDAHLTAVRDAL